MQLLVILSAVWGATDTRPVGKANNTPESSRHQNINKRHGRGKNIPDGAAAAAAAAAAMSPDPAPPTGLGPDPQRNKPPIRGQAADVFQHLSRPVGLGMIHIDGGARMG